MQPDLTTTFDRIRAAVIGYSDAALSATKDRLANELDADPSDMDAILANRFALERCTACGHWFDKRDCKNYDGQGGFECPACAADNEAA